ncbi:MAG: arginine--tRNA ligase [Atribacterota bacterium]
MDNSITEIIKLKVQEVLQDVFPQEGKEVEVVIEPTKDARHGDFATNLAFLLSRRLRRSPHDIAHLLEKPMQGKLQEIARVEIAGLGFINFFLHDRFLLSLLLEVLEEKERFGDLQLGNGKRVQVEFVSVNPTGPLHVGHGKCAAFGDALARILAKAGFTVEKEYYINDAGRQIDLLGMSLEARCRQILGEDVEVPEDGYRGEYLLDIARMFLAEKGREPLNFPEEERKSIFKDFAVEKILKGIRADLDRFRVFFDVWFSERALYQDGAVEVVLKVLSERGYIYKQDGALWLRTTLWGDDKDRVLIRENGMPTYFTSDIAYHWNKWQRGFSRVIDVWGADHHGYVPRMQAAMLALGLPQDFLEVFIVQFVTLLRGGQPERMSTRQGEFVPLKDLLDEVGVDVARYYFLMRDPATHLEFDVEEAKRKSMDNPVYYVQYAHARISSLFKEAEKRKIKVIPFEEVTDLGFQSQEEKEIAKKIIYFKEVVRNAALLRQPYLVCNYLQDLSALFHSFYNLHRILEEEDIRRTSFRLGLCLATQIILKNGFSLLGISAPDSM